MTVRWKRRSPRGALALDPLDVPVTAEAQLQVLEYVGPKVPTIGAKEIEGLGPKFRGSGRGNARAGLRAGG